MQRPLNIFESEAKENKFDRMISLVCTCEHALNIRDDFSMKRFYWFDSRITSFQALWKLLEGRFHHLLNMNNLEISTDLLTNDKKAEGASHHIHQVVVVKDGNFR